MAFLAQWSAAILSAPLACLVVVAWSVILVGDRLDANEKSGRPGAVMVSLAALVVSAISLGGWVVPDALAWSLVGVGLVLGAGAAWYLLLPSRGK